MNPKLATLFDQYDLSQKDIYDFMHIYNLMPDYKKVGAIDNFHIIVENISTLKAEVLAEHEILFGKALGNIQARILENKKKSLTGNTRVEMQILRNMM